MRPLRVLPALALLLFCGCAGVSLESIQREQDLRAPDSAVLKSAAESRFGAIRKRAYLAMGRIQTPAYFETLARGLRDRNAAAREQAAFSLGQLGLAEPEVSSATLLEAARLLAPLVEESTPSLKRAAVEALGKVGGEEAQASLIAQLKDKDAGVRGQAALALFRQVQLGRLPAYSTAAVEGLTALFDDPDYEVRWRAVYAFSRKPEARAAVALSSAALDASDLVKIFAFRGLSQLKGEASWQNLTKALNSTDYLVRAEAVRALGQMGRTDYIVEAVYEDESPHVRAAAADALAAAKDLKLSYWLDQLADDVSPLVKGQALLALAQLRPEKAAPLLEGDRKSENWWVRSKAYEALGALPESGAALGEGLKDKDARVAASALEALAKSSATAVDDALESVLRDPQASLELVGAAAEAALEKKSPRLLEAVRLAYDGGLAKQFPELSDDLVQAEAETLKAHPELGAARLAPRSPIALTPSRFIGDRLPPTTVVLDTEKGRIEIALAVDEAPIHAATFLESVRRGLYDGTIWHRVVTGFVVQGGDPRGSGWGDGEISLRDEINRLPFDRGAVGMPKAGKDTGGCQLFITYLPTPHLDGRYTVFGKVVSGLEVVDKLEPGDKIRRAFVK